MILDAKVPHAISREKLRENGPQATAQPDNLNKTKKEQDQNQNYYSMKAYNNLKDHNKRNKNSPFWTKIYLQQ